MQSDERQLSNEDTESENKIKTEKRKSVTD